MSPIDNVTSPCCAHTSAWAASAPKQQFPSSARPLTELLRCLASIKALAVDRDLANQVFGPLVLQLLGSPLAADSALEEKLCKYGWKGPREGFVRTVDLPGLKSALQKFQYIRQEQLGAGSYGVVHRAQNRETLEWVALKKLKHGMENGFSDSTIREITTMRELRHENIVSLKDIISTVNGVHVHLVLECLDCDLRTYLDRFPEASYLPNIKSIIFQVLAGVRHAHSNCIMHRDLKPQNILVDVSSGQIKLTDFGLARAFLPSERAYSAQVVTLYYRAPELLLGAQCYGAAIDMWSIGCILAELANFEPLFKSDNEIGLLYRIFERLGTPTPEQWHDLTHLPHFSDQFPKWTAKPMSQLVPRLDPEGLDLLSKLLTFDPARRITASQALRHPWFRDVAQGRHT